MSFLPAARVVSRLWVAIFLVPMLMAVVVTVPMAFSAYWLRRRGRMLPRGAAERSRCWRRLGVMRRNGWSRRCGLASKGAVNTSRLCLMRDGMTYRLLAKVAESLAEREAGKAA